MDDRSVSARRVVVRGCEGSRFGRQLLAAAYRQVLPEIRVPLGDAKAASRCNSNHHNMNGRRVGVAGA